MKAVWDCVAQEREKAEDQQRIEALDEESLVLRSQLQQTQEDTEAQQGAFQELEAKYMQMLQLQDESVKFTLQCLKDMQESTCSVVQ